MCALLTQRYYQLLRWTTNLCTVMNLEYNICMTASRDNTSFSISLLNSALVGVVNYSPPCLVACNSLSMLLFSAIKNQTLKLVALVYALVSLTNVAGCLHTSYTITRSSNYIGDMWASGVGTMCDCTTLCCDLSKDMLCISASILSSRIFLSRWSLGTCSTLGFEAWG